jgi:hypothetical protein
MSTPKRIRVPAGRAVPNWNESTSLLEDHFPVTAATIGWLSQLQHWPTGHGGPVTGGGQLSVGDSEVPAIYSTRVLVVFSQKRLVTSGDAEKEYLGLYLIS